MRREIYAGLSVLHAASAAAEYIWPSKYDYIEDVMNLQSGYIRLGFMDAVSPCDFGTNIKGRQNAAEWVRTAYHDMSTHDSAAGTGGIDASIMFELDRDENTGDAFNNTLGFFLNYYTTQSSASDLIALAVITASDFCGGPKIPFRAGRVDATEAGPTGVPEPQQDIETHTSIFAKAGFNTSDMITMVACGHTLGGVHNNDFPEITGDAAVDEVHMFESGTSNAVFDNAVVTEYLDGSSPNPLVSGSNSTTNSDARVFAADGTNATMQALADADAFQARCADIFERMINTVPSTVTLSDPIAPIEVKPYISALAINADGKLAFEGRIRLRVTDRQTEEIAMHLTYADRTGANATNSTIETKRATLKGGTSTGLHGESFAWYEFASTLDAEAGISKFHVHLAYAADGTTSVNDNGGDGFPLEDAVLYQQPQSCVIYSLDGGASNLTVTAAVRKDRAAESLVLDLAHVVARQGVMMPAFEVKTHAFERTEVEKGGYVIFKALAPTEAVSMKRSFDIVLGSGETVSKVEFQNTSPLTDTCGSL